MNFNDFPIFRGEAAKPLSINIYIYIYIDRIYGFRTTITITLNTNILVTRRLGPEPP